MFNLFKKNKVEGERMVLEIEGMHCVSCSMNIDGTLGELPGVVEVRTSYAKGKTEIVYDKGRISGEEIRRQVEELGYVVRVWS